MTKASEAFYLETLIYAALFYDQAQVGAFSAFVRDSIEIGVKSRLMSVTRLVKRGEELVVQL